MHAIWIKNAKSAAEILVPDSRKNSLHEYVITVTVVDLHVFPTFCKLFKRSNLETIDINEMVFAKRRLCF